MLRPPGKIYLGFVSLQHDGIFIEFELWSKKREWNDPGKRPTQGKIHTGGMIFNEMTVNYIVIMLKWAWCRLHRPTRGREYQLRTVITTSVLGPLTRYVLMRVAHAPGMSGTFSPSPLVSDPDMLYGTCVMHVSWCMPGSLTSGFLRSRWRGKCSRHSRRMRNPQFCVSGKRPMVPVAPIITWVSSICTLMTNQMSPSATLT